MRPLLMITASARCRSVLETHSSLTNDLGRYGHLRLEAFRVVRGSRLKPGVEGDTIPRRALPPCRLECPGHCVVDARVDLCATLVPY